MKRDALGRTKTERLVDEARRERRNLILCAVIITALIMFPIGLVVGWVTAA